MSGGTWGRDALVELRAHAVDPELAVSAGVEATKRGLAMLWPEVDGTEHRIVRVHPAKRKQGRPKIEGWPQGATPGLKYLSRPGRSADNRATYDVPTVIIVEGFMQCLAVASHAPAAYQVFGMNGADGINEANAALLRVRGAIVWLVIDADRRSNKRVAGAVERVTGHLRQAGAVEVRLVDVPGSGTDGIDDVLARRDEADRAAFVAGLLDAAGATGRRLVVTRASEITPKASRWLWSEHEGGDGVWASYAVTKHWLPLGGLSLLGGRESTGKSTWTYRLAAKLTVGKLPGCFEGTPRSVVVAATEDDWSHTIVPRLIAAGADLDRVLRVEVVTDDVTAGVTLPADVAALRRICDEHDVALMVLDPLMGAIDRELDSHKDHEVRVALEPVSRFAHEARVTVLGLIHVNKTVGSDLLTRIMGSRAFSAVARVVLMTARDLPEPGSTEVERYLIGQAKNNLAAKVRETKRFEIHGSQVGFDSEAGAEIWSSTVHVTSTRIEFVEDVVRAQENRKPSRKTRRDACEAWLEEQLTGKGRVPFAQLLKAAKEAGFRRTTLYEAREELGLRSVSKPGSTATFWVLDEEDGARGESPDGPDTEDRPYEPDEPDEGSISVRPVRPLGPPPARVCEEEMCCRRCNVPPRRDDFHDDLCRDCYTTSTETVTLDFTTACAWWEPGLIQCHTATTEAFGKTPLCGDHLPPVRDREATRRTA